MLDINIQLEKNGYHSVFDIIRVPHSHFIARHQLDFGQNVEKVCELAVGYATQLSRLFKKILSQTPQKQVLHPLC